MNKELIDPIIADIRQNSPRGDDWLENVHTTKHYANPSEINDSGYWYNIVTYMFEFWVVTSKIKYMLLKHRSHECFGYMTYHYLKRQSQNGELEDTLVRFESNVVAKLDVVKKFSETAIGFGT